MRVTSEFWVAALIRRISGAGGYAVIAKKGAAEAGSIFVTVRRPGGAVELFGPAPQTVYDSSKPEERAFAKMLEHADEPGIEASLLKERRFDEDLWIVEIEPGNTPASELLNVTKP